MLRKDSTSEWIVRDFHTTDKRHVLLKDAQMYDVESDISVQDLSNLATFFNLQYCGPRMNALGDKESVFLETASLLPYF